MTAPAKERKCAQLRVRPNLCTPRQEPLSQSRAPQGNSKEEICTHRMPWNRNGRGVENSAPARWENRRLEGVVSTCSLHCRGCNHPSCRSLDLCICVFSPPVFITVDYFFSLPPFPSLWRGGGTVWVLHYLPACLPACRLPGQDLRQQKERRLETI